MDKKMSAHVTAYKVQLEKGDVQIAYEGLIKYVMSLKAACEKAFPQYSFGNVSPGYMDFTYFPFFDEFLRSKKLRFGIVLNHRNMRFELWLMGQNAETQKNFWELLKTTKWNKNRTVMPKYSVLEVVLAENPDFDEPDVLIAEILKQAACVSKEVSEHINDQKIPK